MKAALARVKTIAGVEGAAIVSRDGLPVLADLPPNFDRETFSAMIAAMLGAAETAMIEIGRGSPSRIVVESRDTRIFAAGLTDELMTVVITRGQGIANGLDPAMEQMRNDVRKAVA